MTYDSLGILRSAGVVRGKVAPQVEKFYEGLSRNEVEVLVSTKQRLEAILPEVTAHSQDWASPEAETEGFDAAMMCACGLWSGSGNGVEA